MDNIYLNFNGNNYKLIFTSHSKERMLERGIGIGLVKDSIESYDLNYQFESKEIVEKDFNIGRIRTVFSLGKNNIILITSMILGK